MDVKPGYKQTETGIIPEDWDAPFLGEIFTFKNGLNKAKKFFGYGTPIVNYMDIYGKRGLFAHDLQGRVSLSKQELKTFEVRRGDVFFTRTSETAEEVGITSVMLDVSEDTVFSGFVLRARPKDDSLDDQFKKYCFSTSVVRKQITSQSTETTRALTNGRYLSTVVIARPPKPEQEAIAEALSHADNLIESLKQLTAKKRHLKQGLMQELLTGKKRLPGFEVKPGYKQTEVGIIPEDWEVSRLGEVVSRFANGGTPSTKHEAYWRGNIPWITGADILNQRVAVIRRFITKDAVRNSSTNIISKGNLLLVSRTGVGKLAISPCDIAISQDFTGIYTKHERLSTEYLFRFLDLNQSILMNQNQGTSILGVTRETLSALTIFFPPTTSEQTAISIILSDMDAEIATLETKLAKFRQIKQGMMQELLTGRIRLI